MRKWTLLAVCLTTFMLLLDITVVVVALPNMQQRFGASLTGLQWVVDAYALSLAALILTAGALADRYGRRLVFMAGVLLFTFSSLLCGLAWNIVSLDVARGATRDRRRRTLRNRTGSHRSRVPRPRPLRSACRLGRHGGGCGCLRPADRRSPHRWPRVALDLLRQHSGRRLRVRGCPHPYLGVPGRGRATYGRERSRDLLRGAVPHRVRHPPRQRQRLDEPPDPPVAGRRGARACLVRRRRAASRAAHVRREALPSASVRRGLDRDVLHRGRHVRDVPVPVDLSAGHPRLLTACDRPTLPAAHRIRLPRAARDATSGRARAPPGDDQRRSCARRRRARV